MFRSDYFNIAKKYIFVEHGAIGAVQHHLFSQHLNLK